MGAVALGEYKTFLDALGGGILGAVILGQFFVITRLWQRVNELVDMMRSDQKEATALHAATAKETARSIDVLADAVKDLRRG